MGDWSLRRLNNMKSITQFTLITLLLAGFSTLSHGHGNKNDKPINPLFTGLESKAAKVVTQFHKALKTNDVKLANSLLSKDVLIYESGNAERSSLKYVSGHMLADMRYLSSVQTELLEHQVKVNGDIAISTSQSKHTRSKTQKTKGSISMETIVVSKIDGEWLITHIHWS